MLTLLGAILLVAALFVSFGVMWNVVYRTFNPPPQQFMMDEEYERNVNRLLKRINRK